jgi:hypothetical protein
MGNDDLSIAEDRIKKGELGEALAALRRAESTFTKNKNIDGLRAVVKLTQEIEPHLSGNRDRSKAGQIAYAASQNIKFFERKSGVAQPEAARDVQTLVHAPAPVKAIHPVEILPATPLDSLARRPRAAVEQGLVPGEEVMVVVRGTGSAAIIGTDRRAFIYKHGMMAGATFGHKLASFEYENVVGIEVHTGALSGAVVIHVPGAASVSTSYWQNAKSDPHKAYNAIPIVRPYGPAQAGAAQLRALISEHSSSKRLDSAPLTPAVPIAHPPEPDPLEALRKLGELRDAGVVTPEEFEAKKALLLSRL